MDDFVGGEDSDDLVFEMFKNLKSCFKSGGFNMRKWVSSLLWMLKFQPSLLKNVRFKKKIRPSQVLSSGKKVTPAV